MCLTRVDRTGGVRDLSYASQGRRLAVVGAEGHLTLVGDHGRAVHPVVDQRRSSPSPGLTKGWTGVAWGLADRLVLGRGDEVWGFAVDHGRVDEGEQAIVAQALRRLFTAQQGLEVRALQFRGSAAAFDTQGVPEEPPKSARNR
ncbi:MAG: hypothetical protein AB7N76_17640 [Planctomycetota bacterium]